MENILKDKSKLNISIDIIMLLLMMPIAGIGFLIKYVLIPGIQRNALYGSNVDLEFLGLTRHEWGTIHLILGIIFLAMLILHIIFHWNMIVCIFRRILPHKILRIVFSGFLLAISLLLISFPLFIKPEIVGRKPLHQNRNIKNKSVTNIPKSNELSKHTNIDALDSNNDKEHKHTLNDGYEVQGSMTLQFVADKYNVPASKIAADLKIPVTLTGEKLGRLKKQYLFTMDDVKKSILKYHKE
jgi:hypothetical protein